MSDGIPEHIKRFLRDTVSSVEQLEILLHLYKHPTGAVSAADVAKALYISPEIAADRLRTYAERGMLTASEESPPRYTFSLTDSESQRMMGDIDRCYRERRVSLINFIYSAPSSTIQSFADAFIIGKKNT